ncbi:MAG: Ig-like domain-containing protein [Nitrospirota bacterium]
MKRLFMMLLALALLSIHCGGGGSGSSGSGKNKSLVTITVGGAGQTASLQIEPETFLVRIKSFIRNLEQTPALASIPSNVHKISFMIAAPDISTMTKDVLVQGQDTIRESFSVPNGKNRFFLVEAKDVSNRVLYRGEATADLDGKPVHLSIIMTALDSTPPHVISTDPVGSATGVPVTSAIVITFSETIDPATFNAGTFSLTANGSPVGGTISINGAIATFTPSSTLAYSTTYVAAITTGVADTSGNHMASDYTWSFITGAAPDTTPPVVSGTSPGVDATGVPITTTVTATFSESMDPSTITSATFLLRDSAGSAVAGAVDYSGLTATFTPSGALQPNVTYTATVTTEAKDLAGNALAADFSWSFTTAGDVAPSVISETPANGATGVPITTVVTATFSEDMDPSTINTSTFTLNSSTGAVSGSVSYSNMTATFTPSAGSIAANTIYTARITTGARDLAGNAMAADFTWSFTTAAPGILSMLPPVASVSPLTNPDSSSGDNVTFTISGGTPPYTVTSSNTTLIPSPGTLTGNTFSVDPDAVCATASVTLTVRDSLMATDTATLTLTPPVLSFFASPVNRTICENDSLCSAARETLFLTLTGVAPFQIVSSNPSVVPDSSLISGYVHIIDAVDNSIVSDTSVGIDIIDNCDRSVNTSVTVLNQGGTIDLLPINPVVSINSISCDITNTGTTPASNVTVYIQYSDGCVFTECVPFTVTVNPVPPSVPVPISISPTSFAVVDYRIIVDPQNVFAETDETDNCIDNSGWCASPPPSTCP